MEDVLDGLDTELARHLSSRRYGGYGVKLGDGERERESTSSEEPRVGEDLPGC